MYTAERQHLRAVLACRHMPDGLALRTYGRGLRPEMPIGVDLHLDAAIGEDALRHHGDEIDGVVVFGGYADFHETMRFCLAGEVASGRRAVTCTAGRPATAAAAR